MFITDSRVIHSFFSLSNSIHLHHQEVSIYRHNSYGLKITYVFTTHFLFFRQWSALQDVVNKDSGSSKINNETLQQIRINNSPAPQNIKLQRAASAKKKKFYQPHDEKIEELNDTLALSMCNASDLSIFSDDDSRDDIILESNMVIRVVKFSCGVYKIGKIFA